MALPDSKIIEICKKAIEEKDIIGAGKEAFTYKIDGFLEYCLRQEKKYNRSSFKISRKLDKFDKENQVTARLDDRFVQGYLHQYRLYNNLKQ